MPGLWDPCFQDVSHIRPARRHLASGPLGFLTAGPTPCHPAVPRKPSARSPADEPSAPTHVTSSATRGLCAFLSDVSGGCGSNSLCSCSHASNPKPLGTCWTTCSALPPASQNKHTVRLCREPFLRCRHRCAVGDDRVIHARFHLLQHPGCRPIELSQEAPDAKTPLGPGHTVGSLTQIDVTTKHRGCSNLPCFHRLLSDLTSLTSKSFHNQRSLRLSQTVLQRSQPRFHE